MSIVVRAAEQRFAVAEVSPRPQRGLRGVAIILSGIVAILVDQTSAAIANAGLPYLAGITAATPDEASWILTAFNAAYYAMILFSPWMMARYGRKRLMLAGLLGFAGTSFVLAFVSDYHAFVALRFAQGAFLGCIYVPAALLFFTSLPTRALKFAPPVFVLISLGGATLGTVVGAYVADEFGGSSVFLPGCFATLMTALLVSVAVNVKDVPQPGVAMDRSGLVLSIASFGALQFLANEGQRRDWFADPSIVLGAVVLALALPAFVLYELYLTRTPHVDVRMFARHRNLAVGALINVTLGVVGYSVTAFVAYLQIALGATATLAGALVLVRVVTYALGVPVAFFSISRRVVNLRVVVATGAIGCAVVLYAFSHTMTTTAEPATFVALSLAFGFFFGMMNQPMGTLVIGSMPLALLAAGVSIYKLSTPLGAMLGTAAMQTLLDHRTASFASELAGRMSLARAPVHRYVWQHHGSVAALGGLVRAQAQTLAYAHVMALLGLVLLIVVPIVCFTKIQPVPAPVPRRATS